MPIFIKTELIKKEYLIQKEDMLVTVSHRGYIKRVALSTYRSQKRGGKGRSGMKMRDEDMVTSLFVTNTHTPILFFTSLMEINFVLNVKTFSRSIFFPISF